jgi:hypothetical protein
MKLNTIALAVSAVALLAAPVLAQTPAPAGAPPSDTVKAVIAKGVMVNFGGMEVDFSYNADGTFTGAGGQFSGKYRTDGQKICISADMLPQELCQEYPDGKKSGDSFDLTSDLGTSTVKIN